MSAEILNSIKENLMKGKANDVKNLCEQAIKQNIPVSQILNDGLISAMQIIGEKFKNNQVYVPEVLIA
ncbi:MAG: B12-binding domain-containing protein, partial [Lentisphaerota bacterium]